MHNAIQHTTHIVVFVFCSHSLKHFNNALIFTIGIWRVGDAVN